MAGRHGLFKVIGHGDGPLARKPIELALRKPRRGHITSIEQQATEYKRELKARGAKEKPANLTVLDKTHSIEVLQKQATNSIHHQYAHFSTTAMNKPYRIAFFKEVFRTLKPRGRFILIDDFSAGVGLFKELKRIGFSVSAKNFSNAELDELNTPDSREFANQHRIILTGLKDFTPEQLDLLKRELEHIVRTRLIKTELPKTKADMDELERDVRRIIKNRLTGNQVIKIIAIKPKQ